MEFLFVMSQQKAPPDSHTSELSNSTVVVGQPNRS